MHKLRNTTHKAILIWFIAWLQANRNWNLSVKNARRFCCRYDCNWDKNKIINEVERGTLEAMLYKD